MPAGWGANNKVTLPLGRHVTQVRDVASVKGTDFKDKTKEIEQFKWGVDVWVNGAWVSDSIYTGKNFADLSKIDNPQFIPKLVRLVRACGLALPTNAEQAAAWDENWMVGRRFVQVVSADEESGAITIKFVPYVEQTPQAEVSQVQATMPPQPVAQPTPPVISPPPVAALAPAAPLMSPPPAAGDPFDGDAGANHPPVTSVPPQTQMMPQMPQPVAAANPWQ